MSRLFLIVLSLMIVLISGCAKPDSVNTIKSPLDGVYYTVETSYGHGAASADFTKVYAHIEHGSRSDKKLVIDGDYLEFSSIVWTGPQDVVLCIKAGITDSFRNEVTLIVESVSMTIHNHLQEHCDSVGK